MLVSPRFVPLRGALRLAGLWCVASAGACDRFTEPDDPATAPAAAAPEPGEKDVPEASGPDDAGAPAPGASPRDDRPTRGAPARAAAVADAEAPTPADADPVDPPPATAEPDDDPFAELTGRLCTRTDADTATVETLKTSAWARYKAKAFADAAAEFACVAARDPGWKHAFNVACASARAGTPEDARVALAEAIRRDRSAAAAAARKDADLATVRALPWFEPTMAPAPAGSVATAVEDDDGPRPGRCPADLPPDAVDACWFEVGADFTYAPLSLGIVLPVEATPPAQPATRRWAKVAQRIDRDAVREAVGLDRVMHPAFAWSQAPMLLTELEGPVDGTSESIAAPFWWWPTDGEAVLVIPLRYGDRRLGVNGAVIARMVDGQLRATNLPVVLASHHGYGGSSNVESGIALRAVDGAELLTLSQVTLDGYPEEGAQDRQLCRIRWDAGALARGCVTRWTDLEP